MLVIRSEREEYGSKGRVIGITGTPGVGKSSVARKLEEMGFRVYSVNELAKELGCILDYEDGCAVVDIETLRRKFRNFLGNFSEDVFVEGHLAHHLSDVAIVLRCNPLVLKERLSGRDWSEEKVMENVEAELVDSILIEAMDNCEEVYEIDTTERDVDDVVSAVMEIVSGRGEKYRPGSVDWLSEVGDRIDELMRK